MDHPRTEMAVRRAGAVKRAAAGAGAGAIGRIVVATVALAACRAAASAGCWCALALRARRSAAMHRRRPLMRGGIHATAEERRSRPAAGSRPRRAKSVGAAPGKQRRFGDSAARHVSRRARRNAEGSKGCPRTRDATPETSTRASAARPHGRRGSMCGTRRGAAARMRPSRLSRRPCRRVARDRVFA